MFADIVINDSTLMQLCIGLFLAPFIMIGLLIYFCARGGKQEWTGKDDDEEKDDGGE